MTANEPAATSPTTLTARPHRLNRSLCWPIALVLLLQAAYGVAFILRSTIPVEGQTYYCLFDDAMISMRYAANLAHGHGLVWNPGERVEGYTNFLWTLVMAACHLPGWSPNITCLVVALLGIPIWWGCSLATLRLARICGLSPTAVLAAVVLLASYYCLAYFTLGGLETGLQTILVTLALADGVQCIRTGRGGARPLVWLAVAMLVRPDAVVLVLWLSAFLFVTIRRGHARVIAGLAVIAAHTWWRHSYYGEWLPNTYYLKATNWPLLNRLEAGLKMSQWTAVSFSLAVLVALIAWFPPRRWQCLLGGAFASGVAYQLYVGGDALPLDRFVVPVAPALAVLTAFGLHRLTPALGLPRRRGAGAALRTTALLVVILGMNLLHIDHWLLITPRQQHGGSLMNMRYVAAVSRISQPDALVAVTWAGVFPYFAGNPCIDLLGKCDPFVARMPARLYIKRAGHNKFDVDASIHRYWPDVVIQVDGKTPELLASYQPVAVDIDGAPVAFFIRKDSPKIHNARPIRLEDAAAIWAKIRQEW